MTLSKPLVVEILDVLERCGCQFFACKGPDRRPEDMITCARCRTLRRLRQAIKRAA